MSRGQGLQSWTASCVYPVDSMRRSRSIYQSTSRGLERSSGTGSLSSLSILCRTAPGTPCFYEVENNKRSTCHPRDTQHLMAPTEGVRNTAIVRRHATVPWRNSQSNLLESLALADRACDQQPQKNSSMTNDRVLDVRVDLVRLSGPSQPLYDHPRRPDRALAYQPSAGNKRSA